MPLDPPVMTATLPSSFPMTSPFVVSYCASVPICTNAPRSKLNRRKPEIFRKRANLLCGTVIVARQEHDSLATMYGRILVKDGSDQMVEALDQSRASKSLRDALGRRLSPQFLKGHAIGICHI